VILVDGHLDLAFNRMCFGRDPRTSALDVRRTEKGMPPSKWRGRCMVGLPELRAGRVALVFGTLFVPRTKDWAESGFDPALAYDTPQEAEKLAQRQIEIYGEVSKDGEGYRLVKSRADLTAVLDEWKDGAAGRVGIVPLMEGADPIVSPDDAPRWFERGVRLVGLAWKSTRYAGGTGEPGPLTATGRKLVKKLDAARIVLDLSHAADQAAHEALDLFDGVVIASHSNPRAICASDRQIPDEIIRRIGERGGVIGAVPFNKMLVAGWTQESGGPVALSRVADCIWHVTQVTGTHTTAAVGSDLDGGFGAESVPKGLDTIADLPRLADEMSARFDDEQIHDVLGRNWIRLLERALPGS
jgi:membrane dipeptidase